MLFRSVGKPPSRREWLRIGLPALLSTSATRAESTAPGFGKARSVLVLFTSGGQSQLDTWDPKPDMPLEVRGAFGTIATSVPGLRVCEHLPQVAKQLHRAALVRSMTHDLVQRGRTEGVDGGGEEGGLSPRLVGVSRRDSKRSVGQFANAKTPP